MRCEEEDCSPGHLEPKHQTLSKTAKTNNKKWLGVWLKW
jgi:hypothetical protein